MDDGSVDDDSDNADNGGDGRPRPPHRHRRRRRDAIRDKCVLTNVRRSAKLVPLGNTAEERRPITDNRARFIRFYAFREAIAELMPSLSP